MSHLTRGILLVYCCVACATAVMAEQSVGNNRPILGTWVGEGGPRGIYKAGFGDPWPTKMIVGDLRKMGVSHVYFCDQAG